MKKKGIIISLIGVLIVSAFTITRIIKNDKKYITYNGATLAMTLTDAFGGTVTITEFPSTNFTVNIECENAVGKWLGDKRKLALENITGKVKCNLQFFYKKTLDNLNQIIPKVGVCSKSEYTTQAKCESGGGTWTSTITNANGYRYSGEDPNNYVWFNNELWRIIGLIPVCTEASNGICSTTKNLVKIIRNNSIGVLAYDANTNGNTNGIWGNNTLYTLLNNYYYGALDGTGTDYCYGNQNISKAKCDYTRIGISSNTSDYYGKMIEPVYWNIGIIKSNTYTPSVMLNYEDSKVTTTTSKIGLMSASDYGYAAKINGYSIKLDSYGTENITKENWLYGQGSEWTNIPYSTTSTTTATAALYSLGYGYIYNSNVNIGFSVRPVVYLDSNVYRISGTGTEADPYIIGM